LVFRCWLNGLSPGTVSPGVIDLRQSVTIKVAGRILAPGDLVNMQKSGNRIRCELFSKSDNLRRTP
jgi:hypothetical protein